MPAHDPEKQKLRGKLIEQRRIGKAAMAASENSTALPSEAYMPGLFGTVEKVSEVLDGKAMLAKGTNASGLWHASLGTITQFSREKAESTGGKFGRGTYLGLNILQGETVNGLFANGAIWHDVELHDTNILIIDRVNVKAVASSLRQLQGLPEPGFTDSRQQAPLSELVEDVVLDDSEVDCVMVYMDSPRLTAEAVLLPRAVDHASLLPHVYEPETK